MNTTLKMVVPVALLFAGGPAHAAATLNFDLVNETGYTIAEVYVGPATSNVWEEDVTGRDFIGNTERWDIRFTPSDSTCIHDIKVVFDDQDEAVWLGIDLCVVSQVTLYYDNESGTTTFLFE